MQRLEAAKQRVNELPDSLARSQDLESLFNLLSVAGGSASVASTLSSQETSDSKPQSENTQRLQLLRGRVQGLLEGQMALRMLPDTVERDEQILSLVEKSGGVLVQDHSDRPVTLNNPGRLFQADECPDASLYCGWY